MTDAQSNWQPNGGRKMWHTKDGAFDFARLVEQLIPAAIMGGIVIFANQKVTEYQIADIRTRMEEARATLSQNQNDMARQMQQQNEKLISLNAQVAAYLGQQTQLNTAMDARLTYIERSTMRLKEH